MWSDGRRVEINAVAVVEQTLLEKLQKDHLVRCGNNCMDRGNIWELINVLHTCDLQLQNNVIIILCILLHV